MTESTSPSSVDVAVLGGGAGGALVACHLLARGARVALVEARPHPALGVAYSTPYGEHLLNVNAARMSAFASVPGDFVAWLQTQPEGAGRDAATLGPWFAPRRLYGRYLQTRLDAHALQAKLIRHTDTAVDAVQAAGGWRVTLASGATLQARAVVLATGNAPAVLPDEAAMPGIIDAWDYAAIAAIPVDARVCIIGAGLSMVDVLLTLDARGHSAHVFALSRNGLMPLAHAPGTRPQAGEVEPMMALGVRGRMRLLRRWAAEAEAGGRPWQDALERLRPHVRALWQAWPPVEQRRFLRHAVRLWDIHRHRIAPEVAGVIERMIETGHVVLHAGRLTRITPCASGFQVEWTPRRAAASTEQVDVLVNAAGMEKRLLRTPNALLRALHARQLITPGPHGLGIATGGDGEVQDGEGRVVSGLWTLGATRLGDLWETIAIPELRDQAERVADGLLRSCDPR